MESNKKLKDKLIARDGLRCSITGEEVSSPDELSIEHIKPISEGGTSDLDNLILVKNSLNRSISKNEQYRTRLLIEELEKRQQELNLREKEAFERENSYRKQIEQQKEELEVYRNRLMHERAEQESRLSKELEERRRSFMEQEEMLQMNMRNIENERKQVQILKEQLSTQEAALKNSYIELEKEKDRYREESRKSIEQKSNEYVNEALSVLETKEKQYHLISKVWSVFGAISILAGIFILSYLGVESFHILEQKENVSWAFLILITFKGLIVVGLFVALAKYSFTFSQSYMHESLKNSERRHAINFGKFYLESYGADADWSQVKEAFEHWNISSSTAFSNNQSDSFDPKTLENAANIIDSISKLTSAQKTREPNEK